MTVYNFNIGLGWASSGVEYAQMYRAEAFREADISGKFIFTDFFHENLALLAENIGFKANEVIWLYQYFTDFKLAHTTYTIRDLETSFVEKPTLIATRDGQKIYTFEAGVKIVATLAKGTQDKVYKTQYYVKDQLQEASYYTSSKLFTEFFKPFEGKTNLYQRRFYNQNGSQAYDELMSYGDSIFVLKDRTIHSKAEFISYFVTQLGLTKQDVIIIDRSTGIGPAVMKSKGQTPVGVVIHADHYSKGNTDNDYILWNNYYEYQFKNFDDINFLITATEAQRQLLIRQMTHYTNNQEIAEKIWSIPVGNLKSLHDDLLHKRKHALVTASRLAGEKHIDWMVEAVVGARKVIPDVSLDIYGVGSEQGKIVKLIAKYEAEDFIHLRGHQDMTDIYENYDGYLTTSTSEGFGLTLLEAVGSGLPIVGFNVDYGNKNFVTTGVNGILVPYDETNIPESISAIENGIIDMLSRPLEDWQKASLELARNYKIDQVANQWLEFLENVKHD